jgi:hypothetical protein
MEARWRARDREGGLILLVNRRAWWTRGRGSKMFLFQPLLGFIKLYPTSSSLIVNGRVRGKPANRGGGCWVKLWGANHRDRGIGGDEVDSGRLGGWGRRVLELWTYRALQEIRGQGQGPDGVRGEGRDLISMMGGEGKGSRDIGQTRGDVKA